MSADDVSGVTTTSERGLRESMILYLSDPSSTSICPQVPARVEFDLVSSWGMFSSVNTPVIENDLNP